MLQPPEFRSLLENASTLADLLLFLNLWLRFWPRSVITLLEHTWGTADNALVVGLSFHWPVVTNELYLSSHFENKLVEKSSREVVLVLFYSDWCMECLRVAPAWRRLVEALRPRGVTLATVHAGHEPLLARQLGLAGLPGLVALVNRRAYVYRETTLSVQKVVGKK